MQTQTESDRLNTNLSANFKVREFICHGCGAEGIKDDLVFHLQKAHDLLPDNSVMIITSGYRCEEHNKEVGGIEDSAHLKGLAADIKVDSSNYRFLLMCALIDAGFKRIGWYDNFIHCDLDTDKPLNVMW